MTAATGSILLTTMARRMALVVPTAAMLVSVVVSACGTTAATPIVYTAPPEILNRTYPPAPSDSGSPDDSAAPTDATPGASGDGTESTAPVLGASTGPNGVIAHPPKGTVIFGSSVGDDGCSVSNQLRKLSVTQSFFFMAYLKDVMDGTQVVTLRVIRDGNTMLNTDEPANGTAFNCFGNQKAFPPLAAGNYEFQVLQGARLEADGLITAG